MYRLYQGIVQGYESLLDAMWYRLLFDADVAINKNKILNAS